MTTQWNDLREQAVCIPWVPPEPTVGQQADLRGTCAGLTGEKILPMPASPQPHPRMEGGFASTRRAVLEVCEPESASLPYGTEYNGAQSDDCLSVATAIPPQMPQLLCWPCLPTRS